MIFINNKYRNNKNLEMNKDLGRIWYKIKSGPDNILFKMIKNIKLEILFLNLPQKENVLINKIVIFF
jgi:hypothetical protein